MESIPFIAWCLEHLNYWVVMLLMTIESSFIPFPSEVVVPPAAYMCATTGEQNVLLVVLAATVGACLGALINYVLARWLGRPLVYRFANSRLGHMCLIDEAKVERAERYFDKHGGLARMGLGRFMLYTALGAGIWNTILAAMGWYIGRHYSGQLEEKVAEYSGELKIVMLAVGVLAVAYLIYKGCKK